MSADLNYTLKRLIRGLTSDNHAVKQGHFIASTLVINRFKKQIDVMKLLKFIAEETKTSKTMKQPEIHAQIIGKLMCLSVIVECQMYQTSQSALNNDAWNTVANSLIHIFKDHEYCRESVQAVIAKMLKNVMPLQHGSKLLDRLVAEVMSNDFKTFIYQHSDNLSLYLTLKTIYLERFQG